MRKLWASSSRLMLLLAALSGDAKPPPDAEQELLIAVRRQIAAELAASLGSELPPGYLAILPPEVEDTERVDATAVSTWATLFAEELRRVRPGTKLTERGSLEAILREQKLGESAYADPGTAVAVGKIAAARSLLLTRFFELRCRGSKIQVHLELKLLDVESGEVVWGRSLHRGMLPAHLRWTLLVAVLAVALLLAPWLRRTPQRSSLR